MVYYVAEKKWLPEMNHVVRTYLRERLKSNKKKLAITSRSNNIFYSDTVDLFHDF